MPVTIDEAISRNRPLESWVQSANTILERMLGRLVGEVTVDWNETEDEHGKPIVVVTLRDFSGSVFTRFTPGELTNPEFVKDRLGRIWRDLLRVGLKKHVQTLQEMIQNVEEN